MSKTQRRFVGGDTHKSNRTAAKRAGFKRNEEKDRGTEPYNPFAQTDEDFDNLDSWHRQFEED